MVEFVAAHEEIVDYVGAAAAAVNSLLGAELIERALEDAASHAESLLKRMVDRLQVARDTPASAVSFVGDLFKTLIPQVLSKVRKRIS